MEINQNSNSTSQSNHNSRNRITSNMVINHNQTSSYYHTKKALWNKVEQKNTKKPLLCIIIFPVFTGKNNKMKQSEQKIRPTIYIIKTNI